MLILFYVLLCDAITPLYVAFAFCIETKPELGFMNLNNNELFGIMQKNLVACAVFSSFDDASHIVS